MLAVVPFGNLDAVVFVAPAAGAFAEWLVVAFAAQAVAALAELTAEACAGLAAAAGYAELDTASFAA